MLQLERDMTQLSSEFVHRLIGLSVRTQVVLRVPLRGRKEVEDLYFAMMGGNEL